ncbi:MAG: extracellular solute-binding protein [Acidimicrobiales bacterium]
MRFVDRTGRSVEYRVLGKLEVVRNGEPVDLGAFRQRSLLAMLLTKPNSVFSTDQLIDGLWVDDGSADKQKSLWVYISGLRKALEPERQKRTDGTILLTRAPGYLIEADPDEVDALRFERLVAEGQSLADQDPAAASIVLGEALALWQGRPFEEFTYEAFAQDEISRLDELRLEAVEARVDADLARGLGRELVSELESLVRQHPLREGMTGQLMQALHRAGRQAEALRSYQSLRTRLGQELGIEPSATLRRLEERMVTGDPTLAPAGIGGSNSPLVAPGLAVRGYELREELGEGEYGTAYRAYQPAMGREVAIKVIAPEFANDPDFIRRFEAEAQLVAGLEHPHIVPLYDYWREPDAAYLVMRLMRGGSLSGVLEARALDTQQAARMVDQLGGALRIAGRVGVAHRDIRPDNVFIDDEGNAYLSDFAIAPEDAEESSDISDLGLLSAQALTGLTGDIEQIRGALPAAALGVIDRATISEAEEAYVDIGVFVADLHAALTGDGAGPVDLDLDNPYKGLRAFEAGDTGQFFGRERLVERLVNRLAGQGTRGRFVAVVGPSGSGKSSVVKAGVLPAVRNGAVPTGNRWFTVEMTPAPHPFEALEEALRSIAVDPPVLLLQVLAGSTDGLQKAVDQALPDDGSQLLLIIDQFEELFTQVDEDTAKRFIDALVGAVSAEHSRLRVVATLRADFYDRPLRHSGLGELLRDGTEVITPMTAGELERAIAGPAESLGVSFEPALVAELVRDVADRPGALPLLQYALTELFDGRAGSVITHVSYREFGGVSGALVARAEGLLANLGDHAHEVTRQVFLRLVTLGEGVEDTRRRVLRSELEDLAVDPRILDGVLDTFGRHRLLSFDRDPVTRGPTVEISHEALLTEWDRLREWIDTARHDVRNLRRLGEAKNEWAAAGGSAEYLLRGGRLDQLHGWASTTTFPLSDQERRYLDASVAERDRVASEEHEREQRVLDAEAAAQHRSRQLTMAGVAGLLVALLAAFGIWQWRSAEDGRTQAETARVDAEVAQVDAEEAQVAAEDARAATELAKEDSDRLITAAAYRAAADAALSDEPELSLLLAVEAVRATAGLGFATEEAVDSLHWALQRRGVHYAVDASAPATLRSGPTGLTGVFVMAPAELVELAEMSTERRLTDNECRSATGIECADPVVVDADLPLRFGEENYAVDIPEVLPGVPAFGDGPLAGTRVTIAAIGNVGSTPGLRAELDRFTSVTGIDVELLSNDNFDLTTGLSTGQVASFPDIAGFFKPPEPWAQDRAVDLSTFIGEETLRSDFGDYLVDLMTSDTQAGSELHGVPMNLHPKGLVYYPRRAFETAGYDVPTTWDELVELSQQLVDDGRTPWCFQWEAGFASGFLGSDYLENLVLRAGGVDVYDEWVAGDRAFDSPEILEAAGLGEEILFGPGFIRGGVESISSTEWPTVMTRLLDVDPLTGAEGPQCWLVQHLAQMADLLGQDASLGTAGKLGDEVNFFMLPPLGAGSPVPVTGSGLLATAMTDRPEIRALMQYIASPEWGVVWAGVEGDTYLSANRRFDTAAYEGMVGPETGRTQPRARGDADARIAMHDAQRAAIDAGAWRYDASDLMPTTFGAWTEDFVPGPFWQGMIDWVDQVRPIEEILADIEAARPD